MTASQRASRFIAVTVLTLLLPVVASAATAEFRVLFDIDNNPATGCAANGLLGVEQILVTRVEVNETESHVTEVHRLLCTPGSLGSSFGPPTSVDPTDYPAAGGNGNTRVETRIAYSDLSGSSTMPVGMRIGFAGTSGLATQTIITEANGDPIIFPDPTPGKRRAIGAGGTRHIILDGERQDWGEIEPLAPGAASGGTSALRIINVYGVGDGTYFFFRFDASVEAEPPVANPDTYSVIQGQILSVGPRGVLSNDTPDPDSLSAQLEPASGPAHGDLDLNADGSFTYAHDGTLSTPDAFQYRASDGALTSDPATVTINIIPNQPPVASNFTYTVNEGGVLIGSLLDHVSDPDSPDSALTFTIDTMPAHGTLNLGANGSFTYTHDDTDTPLTDDFTFHVTDEVTASNIATITINITPVNDPPVNNVPGPQSTNEDTPLVFTGATAISISDADAGANPVQVTLSVTNGTLTLGSTAGLSFTTGDGTADATMTFTGTVAAINTALSTVTFNPTPDYFGPAVLTITTSDQGNSGSGGPQSATSNVNITVNAVNDAPSFTGGPDIFADSNAGPFTQAGWATAIDPGAANESGQTLTFETVSNSDSGLFSIQPAIDATTGTLTFTPVVGAVGSATLVIRLTDTGGTANGGVNASATDTFVITLDVAPTVQSTTPANGATNQAGNTDLTVTFSEPVNVAGNWFQIVCGTSGTRNVADTAVSGGPTTFTINPNADFAAGESCTVTIFAAQVTDQDPNDPPDAMAANYVFSFSIDAAPTVTTTVPANGATGIATDGAITVNFSEPVNATAASATIECPAGSPQAYAVSGSGTASITYTPTADLPAGVTCTVTILAAQITDVDANDPPDTMAANHVFSFTTDAAPAVTTTTPANGATSQPTDDPIIVNFTEPVNATVSSFTIECPVGVPQTFTVGGSGTSTITLTPTADLPSAVTCTVTVIANQISDVDTNDAPDNMAANHVFSFTTDAAPAVTTTTPANGDVVAPNATITVNFTEAVTATTSSFTIACPAAQTFTVGGSGTSTITLTPTTNLPAGSTCTVTVIANQISDVDAADRPDNMVANHVFTFDVDAIPAVTTTNPANGATGVATNAAITVNFSEAVTATTSSFTIECPAGSPQTYNVAGSGTASIVLTPTANLPHSTTCTVTVIANQISDVDANDPPDNMLANYVFSFTTDAPPAVTTTSPANGATGVATNTAITVNFSEPVNATTSSFSIECPVASAQAFTVGGSGTASITLTPTANLPHSTTCTVTVIAAQVTDVDANDPPDTMLANHVFTFTTDAPPAVTTTTPADTTTGVATNTAITVNFSEAVTATTSSFTVECPGGSPQTFTVGGSGTSSITLTPTGNLPDATTCTVTVIANQISDVDANDPPDNMLANYVFSFTTDAPPAVTTTTPTTGDFAPTTTTITVNFTEPVAVTTSSFTIECPAGSPQAFTVGGSGTSTVTLTPSSALPGGVLCTVTVIANQVSDSDAGDPPDTMVANHVFTFTTDAQPAVTTTTPADTATGVATNTTITVNFSEAVTATTSSFTIECPAGSPQAYTVGGSGTASITLTPSANLPHSTTCTVTVIANQISDVDANDPPDNMAANYVFSFTTDAPPAVTTTTPADTATGVAQNATITVNFSEPVAVTTSSFTIECPVASAQAFTVGGSGTASITLTPSANLPHSTVCTVTVIAAQVSDSDANDPPDNMLADHVFSFTTDFPPAVTTTTPADTATGIATNTTITVNFSEAVSATTSSFTVECPVGVPQTFTVGGSGTSAITLTPTADLPAGVTCTVTVIANQVSDVDANDPPDNMTANFVFSFTTDAPPAVTTTTPTTGDTVAPNTTITVNFTENVTATTSSFTIECPVGVPQTFTVGGSGTSSITLTPTTSLPAGVLCTVTVIANQISDSDAGDPPDNMVANHVFTFTTDAEPSVTATTPANGATNQAANTTIQVTFSEPVNATATSATIECPVGVPQAYTVGGSGTATITYTPTANLPFGTTCTVTILAAEITDVDANDPPDNMAANYVFSFSTDAEPAVTATTPTNGAADQPTNTTIQVTFSEPVNATAASATIECPVGVPQAYTVGGTGTATITYTPSANLPAGVTCTVTILAAQITDVDANDPPDTMAANYVFTFSTDAAPAVTTTLPANGATGVGTGTAITVDFTEAVTATTSSFTIECPVGVPQTFTVGGSGTSSITLTPTSNLPEGTVCTVTVIANQIDDVDTNDPPAGMAANVVFSFTTDLAPTVTTTTPTNGATGVSPGDDITVNFSEAVTVTTSSFTIECPVGVPQAFTVGGSGTSTITLNPNADLPGNVICTVTVIANQVSDSDAGDPPDTMAANYVFTFETDAPPSVTTTTPVNGAIDQPTNTTITVNFSETVNASATSATIECPGGSPQAYTVGGTGTATITYTPTANLPAGVTCTVTILAAQITDVDANDPPDNMAANYVFSFSTDAQPTVTATTPTNGATNQPTNTTIQVTFSENVTASATSATIECPVGSAQAYTVGGSGTNVITYTPSANLPAGVTCTVTILAGQIADSDSNDPPDNLAANHVFTFSTDAQPSVTATSPVNAATGIGTDTAIQVTFSESVNATATSATIECPGGSPQAYTVSGSPGTTITYTPNANLPEGTVCTVTILAGQISDVDANDPPDNLAANHVFSFTTDFAPTVSSTNPTNGQDPVVKTSNVVVNFSEAVDLNASSFTIECPVGSARAWTYVGGSTGVTTATLDPTLDLPPGNVCTVTVVASQVTDSDAGDPPNNMAANHVFTFVVRPEAVNDNYPASGNHAIAISAPGVMSNDLGPGITVSRVQNVPGNVGVATATALGGTVTLNADGSFVYDPPRGVVSQNDTFTYRVSNPGTGESNEATVTIGITADIMWYICDGCASTNLGTLRNPYTTIGNFSAANTGAAPNPQPGHRIYIRSGTYDAVDTLVLRDNQIVNGQGVAASAVFTPAANTHGDFAALTAGARPTLQPSGGNGVTLASGNTVQNLNIGVVAGANAKIFGNNFGTLTTDNIILSGNGQALNLTNGTLAGSFDTISSTSGTNNISLTTVNGTLAFDVNGGALSGATGHAVNISGGNVGFNYTGSVTHASAGNALLNVAGGHTGTVTFNGVVSATNGTGLQFSNADGTYRFNNTAGTTTLNGGDAAIDILAGSGGTFSWAETSVITNPTGNLINIDASAPTVTYSGSFTKNNNGTTGIDVTSNTGGSLTIDGDSVANGADGAVETKVLSTTTANAVNLTSNNGMTMTFSGGGLNITTTTGRGFNATGPGAAATTGGTVVVNTDGVNTITSGTGTALYVEHTTIGAGGLFFRSISANGATNGILLNNTGSTAGLTVEGNSAGNCGGTVTVNAVGTAATVGAPVTADCTGGTIQASTGAGISLNNTRNVSLTRMYVLNSGTDGIIVNNINGFTLDRSYVTDGAGVAQDRGIEIGDFATGTAVNGTIAITNSTVGPTPHDNLGIGIGSGTSTWNLTSSVFTGSTLNSGVNFEIRNATVTSWTMDSCVLQNQFADGMQMQPSSTSTGTITSATIQNSTFLNNNLGLDLNHDGTADITYKVFTNTFLDHTSHAMNVFSSAVQAPTTGGTFNARITGNRIGNAATFKSGSDIGSGIRVNINGGADSTVLLDANVIRQTPNGRGMEIISRNGTGGLDVTLTNNNVDPNFVATVENGGFSLSAIFLQSNCLAVCNELRADVRGNTVPAAAPTGELVAGQIAMIETGASTAELVDNGAASANATAELSSQNTGSVAATAGVALIAGPINTPPL